MNKRTAPKKKMSRAVLIIAPIMVLLTVALVVTAAVYFRSAESPAQRADASPAPQTQSGTAPAESAQLPADETETPQPTPYRDVAIYLNVYTSVENLDVVVCDMDGTAVPGYVFPLEISYADGSSHSVYTDVNGHYYAEYMLPGKYTVSMPEFEGFLRPESVSCQVMERLEYVPIANIAEVVEIKEASELPEEELQGPQTHAGESEVEVEEISTEQVEQEAITENPEAEVIVSGQGEDETVGESVKYYKYSYSTGENGFLLFADGTESEILPVEENGNLAYGIRKVTVYYDIDGNEISAEDLPEEFVENTDYYVEEYSEKVDIIFGDGKVDERYDITVEVSEQSVDTPAAVRVGWLEENGRTYYYDSKGRPVTGLKNIDGRLYFFDGTGARASSLGIDVSYFNSTIDWNAVKAAGIDFVIVRVAGRTWNKGVLFEDEDSYRQGKDGGFYLQGAKQAGLKVGAYVYSNAINTNEAVEEASLALEVLSKSGVALEMPVYIDLEFSGEYPYGRADRMSYALRAEIVRAFCTTIESGGYRAGVYAGEDFFSRALKVEDVSDYDIWYASYTRRFALPDFRGFDMWQFSALGRINGMPDYVDMNVIL